VYAAGLGQFTDYGALANPTGIDSTDLGDSITETISNLAPSPGTAPGTGSSFQWGALSIGLLAFAVVFVVAPKR
jgi:hypothetical protein